MAEEIIETVKTKLKRHVKDVVKIPKSGILPARLTSKKRKYTKKPGVTYGRPKK